MRACLAAKDPVAWALVRIGEDHAAARYAAMRRDEADLRGAYSEALGHHIVRALVGDPRAAHAARALVRHARLLAADRRRLASSPRGALAKQLVIFLRGLLEESAMEPPPAEVREEIESLDVLRDAGSLEARAAVIAEGIFAPDLLSGVGNGNDSA